MFKYTRSIMLALLALVLCFGITTTASASAEIPADPALTGVSFNSITPKCGMLNTADATSVTINVTVTGQKGKTFVFQSEPTEYPLWSYYELAFTPDSDDWTADLVVPLKGFEGSNLQMFPYGMEMKATITDSATKKQAVYKSFDLPPCTPRWAIVNRVDRPACNGSGPQTLGKQLVANFTIKGEAGKYVALSGGLNNTTYEDYVYRATVMPDSDNWTSDVTMTLDTYNSMVVQGDSQSMWFAATISGDKFDPFLEATMPACTGGNNAPVAQNDLLEIAQNQTVAIDVLANDSDPDGDSLTITGPGAPLHGSASVVDNKVRYKPDPDYVGVDMFSYTIQDPKGAYASAILRIKVLPSDTPPVNQPPIAKDDHASTEEGQPITIDVLANDSDPEDESLEIWYANMAQHGTLAFTDKIVYTPDPGFVGTDTFVYSIYDSKGNAASATVTVEVKAKQGSDENPNPPSQNPDPGIQNPGSDQGAQQGQQTPAPQGPVVSVPKSEEPQPGPKVNSLKIKLKSKTVKVSRKGTAKVKFSCNEQCGRGSFALTYKGKLVGIVRYNFKSKKSGTVTVKLNNQGKKLLKKAKKHRLKVKALVARDSRDILVGTSAGSLTLRG